MLSDRICLIFYVIVLFFLSLMRVWYNFYLFMIGDEVPNVYLLERVLVLTPHQEGSPFSAKCKFHYQPQTQTINFTRTFQHLCSTHPQLSHLLQNAQLFYVDQRNRTKHFLGEFPLYDSKLLFDDWTTSNIVIAYRKHEPPQAAPLPLFKNTSKKSRERTIKQVKSQIERWRQVAKENHVCGAKGMSLLQAAKSIGMSKKSLDDYLRYLRMGERLNFNFEAFEGEKMGFLRAFVRSKIREPLEQAKIMNEIDSYWDSTYVSKDFS